MNHCTQPHSLKKSQQQGFALIATISIMVLLVMIVIGMLALSTSETKKAKNSEHQLIAQANARMALMIALGKLQETAGSDLAITSFANESMLDGKTVPNSKKRVLGVFSTEQYNSTSNPLTWSNRSDSFKGWLISGQDNDDFLSITEESTAGSVPLTVAGVDQDKKVNAPLVPIYKDGSATGAHAWWISGLGMTASANLAQQGDDPEYAHAAPARFEIGQVAAQRGADWFPTEEEDLNKLFTFKTAETFSGDNQGLNNQTDWLNNSHYALLANTIDGGLKKDLTVALSLGNIADELGDRIFPPALDPKADSSDEDPGGPRWEQAASYYNLASSSDDLTVRPQTETEMGIFPVIAGFTEFFGVSDTTGYSKTAKWNADRGRIKNVSTMHMAPVVKLWNPYNRPLKVSDYTLVVGNSTKQYSNLAGSGQKTDDADNMKFTWDAAAGFKLTRYAPAAMRFEHRYVIKQVTLEPGETKIYSMQSGNVYADSFDGGGYNTAPGEGAKTKSVGTQVDLVGNGFIVAELEEGNPRGYSVWDIHFTKKHLTADQVVASKGSAAAYNQGRCEGFSGDVNSVSFNDGSNTFIFDSTRPDYGFTIKTGDTLNWSLQLYKGKVPKPAPGAPSTETPLVSIKNLNVSAKNRDGSFNETIQTNTLPLENPESNQFFLTGGNFYTSTWARKISLRNLENQGDSDINTYNAAGHDTKKTRFLADFNPRASTIGLWPEEYNKDTSTFYTGSAISVDGKRISPTQKSLGTPGCYVSGVLPVFAAPGSDSGINEAMPQSFIGFSDEGGSDRCVLFEVPDTSNPEKHFFSVGQLRHANFSIENGNYADQLKKNYGMEDFFSDSNRSTYMIGESSADPRLGTTDHEQGKYRQLSYEDASNAGTSTHYDMSWFMNRYLWDNYFFSARNANPAKSSVDKASHNPRIVLAPNGSLETGSTGIHQNAANCYLAGAFNVNSTSKEAWQAFLMSSMGASIDGNTAEETDTPLSRFHKPTSDLLDTSAEISDEEAYAGYRVITAEQAGDLAEKIVEQVKLRGPFYSVSDFINRSTLKDAPEELRRQGALQDAIDLTTINELFDSHQISADDVGSIYDNKVYQGDSAVGVPGYLTQGDICARLGHLMTARSDTFRIRAYGSSLDEKGAVKAHAWCEAEVQRVHQYKDSSNTPDTIFEELSDTNKKFGRKFRVINFRWISPSEISRS